MNGKVLYIVVSYNYSGFLCYIFGAETITINIEVRMWTASCSSHSDFYVYGNGLCYILSPCLFNFYAEYIMRNTGL